VKLDNKEEVLELLEDARQRFPDEMRQARWLLKERDEFLAKMRREGDDIVDAARLQAERMVQRTEIVREAQSSARRIVEEARDEARRLRLEAEDYCDQKLAAFEVVLDRTIKTVSAGREKLSVTPPPILDGPDTRVAGIEDDDLLGGEDAFFDQDRS
jgi:cell division septum initiation protein DivIVA